jgi:PAS domain S-box-containing protein
MKSARTNIIFIGLILGLLFGMAFGHLAHQYMGKTKGLRLDHLKQTVQVARNALEPILVEYRKATISKEAALTKVRNLIRTMVYSDHTGENYVFMSSYDGIMLVQPFETKNELKNVWDLKDAHGVYIIRSLVETAKSEKGEGYVSYYYQRPNDASAQEKVSFVIGIPELDCYIGTGQYMADIRHDQWIYIFQIVGLFFILLVVLYFLVSEAMNELRARNMLLHKAEQELKGIFDNTFQFIGTLTKEGVLTRANRTSVEFAGVPEENVIGKFFWETPWWTIEEDKNRIKQAIRDSAQGQFCRFECSHLSEKHGMIFVDFNISPIVDPDGNIVSLLAEGRDVSEQTEIRKELIKEKAFFEYVIDSLPGLFFLYRQEGNDFYLKEWNAEQFEKILGYPQSQLKDAPITKFIDAKDLDSFNKVMASLFEVGRLTFEFNAKSKDNKSVPILYMANYFEFSEEKFIVGTGIELTEKLKAEEEKEKLELMLTQSRKMEALGVLAGGIAHDFNNILSAVLGYAELAQAKLPVESPVNAMQGKIINAAVRAKNLVNQILLFSRKTKIEIKPVLLELIIEETVTLLRSTIPTTIEIKQNISKGLGVVLADATQIHQVIMNLCTNAYHAMQKSGGTLTVSLNERKIHETDFIYSQLSLEPGIYQVLEISDTGVGMDKMTLSKIFDPYFTTKERGDGTGLGLSVVHGIIKNYGGGIKVFSELGHGTCFQVYLPKAVDQTRETSYLEQPVFQRGNENILLVDDDYMILELAIHSLSDLGYKISSFSTGTEALEAFSANPTNFDLVITDMTMPKMTGIDLSKEIMKIRPQMPIILCTGHSDLINEEKAKDLGIKAFLVKPLLREEVSRTIREILDTNNSQE